MHPCAHALKTILCLLFPDVSVGDRVRFKGFRHELVSTAVVYPKRFADRMWVLFGCLARKLLRRGAAAMRRTKIACATRHHLCRCFAFRDAGARRTRSCMSSGAFVLRQRVGHVLTLTFGFRAATEVDFRTNVRRVSQAPFHGVFQPAASGSVRKSKLKALQPYSC